MICLGCREAVDENYGVARCPTCGNVRCVKNCIPGGVGTVCLVCEESEDDQ